MWPFKNTYSAKASSSFSDLKPTITFDDVVLEPQYSDISSRKDVDTSSRFLNKKDLLRSPIIAANMDTVVNVNVARLMQDYGGMAILHRYQSKEETLFQIKELVSSGHRAIPSIGIQEGEYEKAVEYMEAGASAINVDIAHGDSKHMVTMVRRLSKTKVNGKKITVIAGNVATKAGALRLLRAGASVIKGGVGPGCFAKDTKVMMADGSYKNIQDIKVHDRVINMEGNPVNVVAVKFTGYKKVTKYKSNFWHTDTFCTPDHGHFIRDLSTIKNPQKVSKVEKLDLLTKKEQSKYKWKQIYDCNPLNTYLLLPKTIKFDTKPTFEIDLNKLALSRRIMYSFKERPILGPSYELGYLIGTFLGDGCARISTSTRNSGRRNTSGHMNWYFGLQEKDIAEKVSKYVESVFNYKPLIEIVKSRNMTLVTVRSNPIIRFFEQFGKRTEKYLPEYLRCSDVNYCKGLFDGLVDSDGHEAKDGRTGFTNTSEHLIELFAWLHYMVKGFWPSGLAKEPPETHHWGDTSNWKTAYYYRSVTRPEFNLTKKYQVSTINKIEHNFTDMPTYDIEVDCPTHSFIANNVIVHNSSCQTRDVAGHGVPQLTAIKEIASLKTWYRNFTLIADGGIRKPADLAKALAFGADLVMVGSIFGSCIESPGELIQGQKVYRGMASKEARADFDPDIPIDYSAEGVSMMRTVTGTLKQAVDKLMGGLRSGMSYSGAHSIKEYRQKARFMLVSNHGFVEGTPHGLKSG